jgi:aspartate aminotransferase/aromatic-amino-acid transaminase
MSSFLNKQSDGKMMVDKVFKAAIKAREAKEKYGDDQVVDATLGTLFDEDGNFVAFDSVWGPYNEIDKVQKAKYAASIQGNPKFREAVYNWLFGEINEPVQCEILATPGGAGAISSTMKNILNPGETVIKPSLGWGPYKTMAAEFGLKLTSYNMFKDNQFDLEDFKATLNKVMEEQEKVLVIINDPCHNPTGYTMSNKEWQDVIDFTNELSKKGPVVLLNDIAYVDFNLKGSAWKKNFKRFNQLSENAMAIIAFSTSKTLTAYGARAGAAVAITKNKEELQKFINAGIYSARSIWSTVNNSAMELFALITQDEEKRETYVKEKQYYVDLLKERADIFVTESNEVGLEIYPHVEGFFVTVKVPNNEEKEALNLKLQEHNIFTVEVDGGLRVAICSVPRRKLKGLAGRIKEIMN